IPLKPRRSKRRFSDPHAEGSAAEFAIHQRKLFLGRDVPARLAVEIHRPQLTDFGLKMVRRAEHGVADPDGPRPDRMVRALAEAFVPTARLGGPLGPVHLFWPH